MTAFGPRASIKRVGVCAQLPDGTWWLTGWVMDDRADPRVLEHGCMYMHDEEGFHVGILGWLFSDLVAVSEAQGALGAVPTTDSPS